MDINALKRKKADLLAEAQKINDKLSDPDFTVDATRRSELEKEADTKIAEATEVQAEIEAKLKAEEDSIRRAETLKNLSHDPEANHRTAKSDQLTGKIEVGEPGFVKDPMKGFKSHREFLKTVAAHPNGAPVSQARDERLRYLAAAGSDEHQTGSDPYGGFLVPEGMAPGVMTVADEGNLFTGPYAPTPITMDSPTFKVNAVVDKNHSSSVTGGLTVSRSAETAAKTSSRTKFEQVVFQATSVFGLAYATEEQLSDSPGSFASFIASQFGREFTSNHVKELLRGTGVGEPEGIQTSPALVTVAKESMQTADTIVGENLVKMRSRCWDFSNAIWIANHDTYPQLVTAKLEGTNSDVFLFQPGRGIDAPETLLGRPIFFSEYAETLGDKNDIMLVVPSQIYRGVYQPLESAESIHVRFENHERAYKFYTRDDARSLWRSALTPNKSSNTLSPFVTLAARA